MPKCQETVTRIVRKSRATDKPCSSIHRFPFNGKQNRGISTYFKIKLILQIERIVDDPKSDVPVRTGMENADEPRGPISWGDVHASNRRSSPRVRLYRSPMNRRKSEGPSLRPSFARRTAGGRSRNSYRRDPSGCFRVRHTATVCYLCGHSFYMNGSPQELATAIDTRDRIKSLRHLIVVLNEPGHAFCLGKRYLQPRRHAKTIQFLAE
jgi:hypothetical protein